MLVCLTWTPIYASSLNFSQPQDALSETFVRRVKVLFCFLTFQGYVLPQRM